MKFALKASGKNQSPKNMKCKFTTFARNGIRYEVAVNKKISQFEVHASMAVK